VFSTLCPLFSKFSSSCDGTANVAEEKAGTGEKRGRKAKGKVGERENVVSNDTIIGNRRSKRLRILADGAGEEQSESEHEEDTGICEDFEEVCTQIL